MAVHPEIPLYNNRNCFTTVHAVISAALQHLQGVSMLSTKLPCHLNCVPLRARLLWIKRVQAPAGNSDLTSKRGFAVNGAPMLSTATVLLTAANIGCALPLQKSFSERTAQRDVLSGDSVVTLTRLTLTTTTIPQHRLQHPNQMWQCLTSLFPYLLPSLPLSGESS